METGFVTVRIEVEQMRHAIMKHIALQHPAIAEMMGRQINAALENFDYEQIVRTATRDALAGSIHDFFKYGEGKRTIDAAVSSSLRALMSGVTTGKVVEESGYRQFAREVINMVWDGDSIDGGDLQELAESHGIIEAVRMTEPCGSGCRCAEANGFPSVCYRFTDP